MLFFTLLRLVSIILLLLLDAWGALTAEVTDTTTKCGT